MQVDPKLRRRFEKEYAEGSRSQARAYRRKGFGCELYVQSCAKREFVKRLRERATDAETLLWSKLQRGKQGVRWRSQRRALGWILDFFCSARSLCVEVDGSSHIGREDYDARRDAVLARHGVRTLRFTNAEVLADVDSVVRKINEAAEGRPDVALSKTAWAARPLPPKPKSAKPPRARKRPLTIDDIRARSLEYAEGRMK